MIQAPDYRYATNIAYQELEKYEGEFPQINVFQLLLNYPNIILKPYTEAAKLCGRTYNDFIYNVAESEFGYSALELKTRKNIIYFNDFKSETTTKFTIVHELGHILLGHVMKNKSEEKEANCFARNILCPVPIIEEYKLSTPEEYSACFDVSLLMAKVAIEHYSSDCFYIDRNLYEKVRDKIYCFMTGYTLAEIYGCY